MFQHRARVIENPLHRANIISEKPIAFSFKLTYWTIPFSTQIFSDNVSFHSNSLRELFPQRREKRTKRTSKRFNSKFVLFLSHKVWLVSSAFCFQQMYYTICRYFTTRRSQSNGQEGAFSSNRRRRPPRLLARGPYVRRCYPDRCTSLSTTHAKVSAVGILKTGE